MTQISNDMKPEEHRFVKDNSTLQPTVVDSAERQSSISFAQRLESGLLCPGQTQYVSRGWAAGKAC
jgi:hypothetical protein